MDEQVWLSGDNVAKMLRYLREEHRAARTKAGRRKLRLFQAACFRRIWEVLPDHARRIAEAVEQQADGRLAEKDAARAHQQAQEFSRDLGYGVTFDSWLATALLRATAAGDLGDMARKTSKALCLAQTDPEAPFASTHPRLVQSRKTTQRRHAELLREIFGNPFRPPPKRTFAAELRGLAQACYDDHSHYPVLADALADAGEDEAAAHCRLPAHVRGCHVVDWVLGKA